MASGRRCALNLAAVAVLASAGAGAGCRYGDNLVPTPYDGDTEVGLVRAFRGADVAGCAWASPVLVDIAGVRHVVVATTEGHVVAHDRDGGVRWSLQLPAPAGRRAWLAATPAVIDERLVVAWQEATAGSEDRFAHHVAVIDAATGTLDAAFPIVTLAATVRSSDDTGDVPFLPSNNFSRSTLAHARRPGDELGLIYVSFGNLRDIQPWHGWVFELDLDAWRAGGADAALSAALLTTPEHECGIPGESGSDDMICGGGVWAPSGPQVVPSDGPDGFALLVPTGNGQLDLDRGDYANTVMRVGAGLTFTPGCDPVACADFDPIAPAEACMASCRDVFMPRLAAGDPPLAPPNDRCKDLTFLECYAELDLDLGADSPARTVLSSGRAVIVLPAKDGAVYLFDDDVMGTMLARLEVREFCGSNGGDCTANWAGTMVTEPVITEVDGTTVALVPTFYFDHTNGAGVVALELEDAAGEPTLRLRWQAPAAGDPEAVERFRDHTGRLALITFDGVEYAALADPGEENSTDGRLYLIRVADGAIVERGGLDGPGHKYIEPAIDGDRVFITSCTTIGNGPVHLEGWDVIRVVQAN